MKCICVAVCSWHANCDGLFCSYRMLCDAYDYAVSCEAFHTFHYVCAHCSLLRDKTSGAVECRLQIEPTPPCLAKLWQRSLFVPWCL